MMERKILFEYLKMERKILRLQKKYLPSGILKYKKFNKCAKIIFVEHSF